MSISIDIPDKWRLDETSDAEISSEGDSIVFVNQSNNVTCRISGVKEVSDRLDFLGEVVDENDEELESLWLSSDDYTTVSHARDEIVEWGEGQMKSYSYY